MSDSHNPRPNRLFSPEHQAHFPEFYAVREDVEAGRLGGGMKSSGVTIAIGSENAATYYAPATSRTGLIRRRSVAWVPDLEKRIVQKFTSEPLASDPKNHCIRLLEILSVADAELMRLRLLFNWNYPRFATIGKVVDFLTQFSKFVPTWATRTGEITNLLDRACISCTAIMFGTARTRKPMKYYWIDFDVSAEHDPAEGPPLSEERPGVPLQRQNHDERRTGQKAQHGRRCQEIKADLSHWKLGSRFVRMEERDWIGIFRSTAHWVRQACLVLEQRPAIPSPKPSAFLCKV
ncbi:hypothetical protein B0H17DRAFT_1128910 [Mycena rosella]|uniref:Uncharacterized protein n=1 Tax=Mycena rosella TaxID=1033263 RepID=A0AAD7GQ41_MYCRO|nr:hypothetical protein B0H17DRAFT_1128910 [Mycena rosella]